MIQYILISILTTLSIGSYLLNTVKKEHNNRINEMIKHNLEISKNCDDKQEVKDTLKTVYELHKLII